MAFIRFYFDELDDSSDGSSGGSGPSVLTVVYVPDDVVPASSIRPTGIVNLGLIVYGIESNSVYATTNGTTWAVASTGADTNSNAITYGFSVALGTNVLVSIGSAGGSVGTVCTSPTGVTWTDRGLGASTKTYVSAAFDSTTNIFVAAGSSGFAARSADGTTWTEAVTNVATQLTGIVNANGVFVAVGYGGSIQTSVNGTAWTTRTSGTTEDLYAVTFGNAQFVAVGNNGTILTSPDGTTWTPQVGDPMDLKAVAAGAGYFVTVGYTGEAWSSIDGITWTLFRAAPAYYVDECYGVYLSGLTFVFSMAVVTVLPTDNRIWLDASQLTEANTTLLTPWLDLSGYNNHFSISSGAVQAPEVRTNIQNGFRGVRFFTGAIGLRETTLDFDTLGTATVIVVQKSIDDNITYSLAATTTLGPRRTVQSVTRNWSITYNNLTVPASNHYYYNNLGALYINGPTVRLTTINNAQAPAVHAFKAGPSGGQYLIDNVSAGTSATVPLLGTLALGQDGLIAESGACYIFELRAFIRVLTANEIKALTFYLKQKWALVTLPTATDPVMDIDASVLTEANNTPLVGNWIDQSGYLNNLYGDNNGAGGTTVPTIFTNVQNGLRGALFVPGHGMKSLGPLFESSVQGTVSPRIDFTIIVIANYTAGNGGSLRMIQGYGNNIFLRNNGVNNLELGYVNGGVTILGPVVLTQATTRDHVVTAGAAGGTYAIDGTSVSSNAMIPLMSLLAIGRGGSIAENYAGYIFEIKMWKRVLSAAEILAERTALRAKWGI